MGESWFVDDSSLVQVANTAEEAVAAVEEKTNATGLLYTLLGLERRPTKVHLVLAGAPRGQSHTVECKHWVSEWCGDKLSLVEAKSTKIVQEEAGKEVRTLGLFVDEKGGVESWLV